MSAAKTRKANARRPKAKGAKAKSSRAKSSRAKSSRAKSSRAKSSRAKSSRAKSAKAKNAKTKSAKRRGAKILRAKPKSVAPVLARAFRFTAAHIVQIRFGGAKTPESFRVDDMAEASLATLDGATKHYFQYRLVSNDKQNPDGSERCFWFFDPKPVGLADPVYPLLWRPASAASVEGSAVPSHSGNFSTRSVTGYDGSGSCHMVKLDDKPSYRLRFDFNGKREFCASLPVVIGKGDVLSVTGS